MESLMDGDQGSRSQMVGNLEELRARGQAVIESLFSIQLETLLEVQKRLSAERPSPEGLPRPFPGHRRPLPGVGLPGDGPGPDHRLGQDRFSFCHPGGEGGVGPDQYQKHPLLDLFGDDPKSRRPLSIPMIVTFLLPWGPSTWSSTRPSIPPSCPSTWCPHPPPRRSRSGCRRTG